MNVHRRAGRAVLLTAALLAAAHFGLQGEYRAAPARAAVDAMPDQQAVQASGFVTYGNGTCFPDAVLLDCSGNVTHQLKGPGGSAFFAAFIGQWVDLAGTELTCVVGDKYISVATLEVKPAPCGTPATPTPTPPPGPTATFTATPPPTLPPGVTPTATPLIAGNLALGKAIYASSQPDAAHPAASAVDGDTGTSWSSIPDPQPVWDMRHLQWIYVDLGAEYEVKDMRMLWVTGRNPRVYAVYVWRDAWNAWQWVARTDYGKVDDPVSFPFEVTGRYFMLWLEVPALAGSHYELAEWQIGGDASAPIQSTNVAAGRASIAYSREPGYDAGNATDANLATEWRSSAGLPQWLYVDLTTSYRIDRAILRWVAGMHATTYTLYSWSGSSWQAIYTTYRGAGAEETVTFSPVNTRYLLVYASAGPSTSVGLRELEVYEARGSGSGLPRPFAAQASGPGLAGWSFGNGSRPVLGQASAAGSMSAAPVAGDESPMVLHGAPPAVPVPVR